MPSFAGVGKLRIELVPVVFDGGWSTAQSITNNIERFGKSIEAKSFESQFIEFGQEKSCKDQLIPGAKICSIG